MAATPIYGKTPLRNVLFQSQEANDLGTWYVALGMQGLPNCLLSDKVKFAS